MFSSNQFEASLRKNGTSHSLTVVCMTIQALLFCSLSFSQQVELDDVRSIETELRTLSNESISLPPKQGHLVVCFLGIECPLAKLYAPRINQIAVEYAAKGFQFVAINSNRQDSTEEWREFAKSVELVFPIVKDHNNLIADKLGVIRNPEVIVIAPDGSVPYRGRVDDQYSPGVVRAKVSRQELKTALMELDRGVPVSVPVTKPEGCLIGKVKKPANEATVTYSQHLSLIHI